MWKAKKDVVWKKKDDMLVLLKTSTGHYFTVNQVGAILWDMHIEKCLPLEQVVDHICDSYENVPNKETVKADLAKMMDEWQSENIIED